MTSNRVCDGSFGPPCESQVRSSSIICQRIYHANVIFVRTCALSRYKFSVTIFSRIATLQARVQNATYGCRWSVVCLSVYCERWLSRSRFRFGVNSVEPKEPLDEGRDPPRKEAVLGTYSGMPARWIFSTLFARRRHVRCVISLSVLYGNFS